MSLRHYSASASSIHFCGFLLCTFFFHLSFSFSFKICYLKDRLREREAEEKCERVTSLLDSFPKWPQQLDLGQAESRSPSRSPTWLWGVEGPGLLLSIHISRALAHKWSCWDSTWRSGRILVPQVVPITLVVPLPSLQADFCVCIKVVNFRNCHSSILGPPPLFQISPVSRLVIKLYFSPTPLFWLHSLPPIVSVPFYCLRRMGNHSHTPLPGC